MNYFYVLQLKDTKYYYGSTKNLKKRIRKHQTSKVYSTKNRLPLNLVYYEAYQSLKQARMREKQVKTSGSARRTLHKRMIIVGP